MRFCFKAPGFKTKINLLFIMKKNLKKTNLKSAYLEENFEPHTNIIYHKVHYHEIENIIKLDSSNFLSI